MIEENKSPANDDAPDPLTIPPSLDPAHAVLLREHGFEDAGHLAWVLKTKVYDGHRIVYVITNPERTATHGDADDFLSMVELVRKCLEP